jgi:hypothetical protein
MQLIYLMLQRCYRMTMSSHAHWGPGSRMKTIELKNLLLQKGYGMKSIQILLRGYRMKLLDRAECVRCHWAACINTIKGFQSTTKNWVGTVKRAQVSVSRIESKNKQLEQVSRIKSTKLKNLLLEGGFRIK